MKHVAMISINGGGDAGGVERVVDEHRRILSRLARVRIFSLPQSGWVGRLRRVRALNALLMAGFPLLSSLGARAWAGRKGVVISHGYSSTGAYCNFVFAHGCWAGYTRSTGLRSGLFGRAILLYEWLSAHLAHRVVCVSDSVAEQWTNHYGLSARKTIILANAVNTSIFRPLEGARNPGTGDKLQVLFVGRFEPAKGVAYLEKFHEEMDAARDEISLCVCSPAPAPEWAQTRFPRFRFRCGLKPWELVEEYNKADVFLLPSLYEAFEMSTIEALACGTPVMLNRTGSRPTLEKLGCPCVYRIEEGGHPLGAVRKAAEKFRGLQRESIAAWTELHFGTAKLEVRLAALCGLEIPAG